MLKIKDNVDLRILKKYGFRIDTSSIEGIGSFDWGNNFIDDYFGMLISENGEGNIFIDDTSRHIHITMSDNIDVLYDLIKDGLVEKVSDK